MKLVTLVKILLNETCSIFYIGKHLYDTCPIQNGLKYGDALSLFLFNSCLEHAIRKNETNQEELLIMLFQWVKS